MQGANKIGLKWAQRAQGEEEGLSKLEAMAKGQASDNWVQSRNERGVQVE